MSNGGGAAVAIVAMGAAYWFGVLAAGAIAFTFLGLGALLVGGVIYLLLAGRAYVRAFRSGSFSRVLDAIAAPVAGVAVGYTVGDGFGSFLSHRFLPGWAYMMENHVWFWPIGLVIWFGVLTFGVWGGFSFPWFISSDDGRRRLTGYGICLFFGAFYFGVSNIYLAGKGCLGSPSEACPYVPWVHHST